MQRVGKAQISFFLSLLNHTHAQQKSKPNKKREDISEGCRVNTLFGWSRAPRAGAGARERVGSGLRAGAGPACPRAPGGEGRGGEERRREGGKEGRRQGAGWGEGKAPRVLPEERRRRRRRRERREQREGGRESGSACHVPFLTLGASCRTSPRKSTGKWQTGLTGFTSSSLDRAAHYHNRLQRRRRSAPVAAAGPAGTLARRAPAATADRAAGPGPARVCTGGRAGAEPGEGQQQLERRGRRLPADPAVRAGLGAGGGGGEAGPGGARQPVPSGVCWG